MRRAHPLPCSEDGFSLVEVLATLVVLTIGLFGALTLVNGANTTNTRNTQRVVATNIARELIEGARTVDYDDLTPTLIAAAIQRLPNLASTGTGWTIVRRNITYTITASTCIYDDPSDNMAIPPDVGSPQVVCAGPARDTTRDADKNGDDFRRVTFRVSWIGRRGTTVSITQTALVANPAGGLGPRIITLTATNDPLGPTSGNNATFTATSQAADALSWKVDDGKSEGSVTGRAATSWSFSWALGTPGAAGSVLDGTYQLSAQAFSERSIPGEARVVTVQINRSDPFAPTGFIGGHDTRRADILEFDWNTNAERDIVGYRVYWEGANGVVGGGDDSLVCTTNATTPTCTVTSPQPGAGKYYVKALDTKNGAVNEGALTEFSVVAPTTRPARPNGPLTATLFEGRPQLNWTAAPTSAGILFYRIYRDSGTEYVDRYGRTGSATPTWTDSAPGSTTQHQYWVTAIDSRYNESDPLGPVTSP